MHRPLLVLAVLSVALFGLGYAGVRQANATYDTWWASGNYLRTDPYGTNFYAQTALWYDPYTDPLFGPGLSIWRTYLQMDITSSPGMLNCDSNALSGPAQYPGKRNWYNAPFPLYYSNTPAWDYNTWSSGWTFTVSQQFGASRDEQCNLGSSVPVGAYFSTSTVNGGFSAGPW